MLGASSEQLPRPVGPNNNYSAGDGDLGSLLLVFDDWVTARLIYFSDDLPLDGPEKLITPGITSFSDDIPFDVPGY